MVIVKQAVDQNVVATYLEVGRTEHIPNQMNPIFRQSIIMDYNFDSQHPIRILVYDIDHGDTQSK